MKTNIARRDILKAMPVAAGALTYFSRHSRAFGAAMSPAVKPAAQLRLEAFDYHGVTLLDSRWRQQVTTAREFYLGLSDDDILCGFRDQAGMPAPGKPLGGWASVTTNGLLGDWISAMSRLYCATGDQALMDKATFLMTEWYKTVPADGKPRVEFAKLNCGLVDMYVYGGNRGAMAMLERSTDWAIKNISRERLAAIKDDNVLYSGRPGEWYKQSENLYRAYLATGDPKYRDFAEVWLYPSYWNKFASTGDPADAQGVHAFSHVNTFSSAAMHYSVTGDPKTLEILKNFYDYMQTRQCFATGGYGPNERFMASDGSLGRSLDARSDSFETECGSWAGFKLSRHLMQFTGDARYGDWIERLVYNGAGASLPLAPGGRNFYYSDYRIAGGIKVYRWDNFTCCSGTYFQNMADYHNLIYYKDDAGLYVNLYLPSQVVWRHRDAEVTLVQQTGYPLQESGSLTLRMDRPLAFPLSLRVPGWCKGMTMKVNGAPVSVLCAPGTWAGITRTWNPGDKVEYHLPMPLRTQPVDPQHPDRVAVVHGPVVLALDSDYHDPNFKMPADDEQLNRLVIADDSPLASHFSAPAVPGMYRVERADGKPVRLRFRPFFAYNEGFPYQLYIDRQSWPYRLW